MMFDKKKHIVSQYRPMCVGMCADMRVCVGCLCACLHVFGFSSEKHMLTLNTKTK
eukprot:m.24350 g.24350  ORF g.24350 m.24350 type:complete len:55 (-) comp14564_c0_seq1:259-423(-)